MNYQKTYSEKWNIVQKAVFFVVLALVYCFLQYWFNIYYLDVTVSFPQPTSALCEVNSICFGWLGILACATGSAMEGFFLEPEWAGISPFMAGILSWILISVNGIISRYLWMALSKGESNIFRLDSSRRVLRYATVAFSNSIITGAIKCAGSFAWGDIRGGFLVRALFTAFLDYFDMTMLFGLPLMALLSIIFDSKWQKGIKIRKLYTSEKLVFGAFIVNALCLIIVSFEVYLRLHDTVSAAILNNQSYIVGLIASNIVILATLIAVCGAFYRDGFFRACEKAIFGLSLVMASLNLIMMFRVISIGAMYVYTTNTTLYAVSQLLCAIMLGSSIFDKHEVSPQSVLFISLVFITSLQLLLTAYEYYSRAMGGSVESIAYLESIAYIFECIAIAVYGAFIRITLSVPKEKYKWLDWGCRLILLSVAFIQASRTAGGFSSYVGTNGEMIENVTWFYTVGLLSVLSYYIYLAIKHRKAQVETLALILLNVFAIFSTIMTVVNPAIYLFPVVQIMGLVACFGSVYVKRSNSFDDTQKDLDFAANIQVSMLPTDFESHGFANVDLFASMHPAKNVGGDFYDFFRVSDRHLVIVIADVSGKGLPAAMVMMRAITAIKNYALAGLPVDRLAEMASDNINEHNNAMLFVTGWIGLINTETGSLRYVNAGHNPPLLKHADGSIDVLDEEPDMIMGFFSGNKYRKRQLQMEEGDILYLYTDGITEAITTSDEQYGINRLIECVKGDSSDARSLCLKVSSDVENFVGTAAQFDDQTMLALKYSKDVIAKETLIPDNSGSKVQARLEGLSSLVNGEFEELSSGNAILIDEVSSDAALDIEIISAEEARTGEIYAEPLEIEIVESEGVSLAGIVAEPIEIEPLEIEEIALGDEVAEPLEIEILSAEEISVEPIPSGTAYTRIVDECDGDGYKIKFTEVNGDEIEINTITISCDSSKSNVDSITSEMDDFLDLIGCNNANIIRLNIVLDEVFSNICNYAYKDGIGPCTINLEKLDNPPGIKMEIIDSGIAYNPLEKENPDDDRTIEERSKGGAGIYIVKQTMDDVQYLRENGQNKLTIIKYF